MNEHEILSEVKKAIDLYNDKTYTDSEFYSHVLRIIKDNSGAAEYHKEQMERLMFRVSQLRENQRLYWGGHKSKLGECKIQEVEMDKKIIYLCTHGGYSIERFNKLKPVQNSIFGNGTTK